MIHARKDYNRFQDPAHINPYLLGEGSTPIGDDEPVILFRAKDKHFLAILDYYFSTLEDDPDIPEDSPMLDAIFKHIERTREWQKSHQTKTPDMPEDSVY